MNVRSTTGRGFTLIEVMIVVAIAAIVMTAAIPMMWKMLARDQMAKAVNDVIEGCKTARDRAILQNKPFEFVIRNRSEEDAEMNVEAAPMKDKAYDPSAAASSVTVASAARKGDTREPASMVGGFPRKLGEDVMIQLIDVNFIDHMEASEARVRFYPNGTSDEFTVVLKKDNVQRTVKVDIITGTAFEIINK